MSFESVSNNFQQNGLLDQYISKFERPLKHVLSHEYGNGSLCNRCDCPGLDLHYWRKICKICACRLDEHDVLLANEQDHGTIVARKLFDRSKKRCSGASSVASSANSTASSLDLPDNFGISKTLRTSQSPPQAATDQSGANASPVTMKAYRNSDVEHAAERDAWAWTPAGDWRLARRYLLSLPEAQRPLKGTPGAQLRRQRLAQQLPYHDSDVEHSKMHKLIFCCLGCDQHLSGQRYIVKDDQPFCVACYMQKFARTCLTCNDKIAPFAQRVSYGDLHWHADGRCFKCGYCYKPLSNEQFLLKQTRPFCSSECKMASE
uniref:LIM zinc-binding domain-containing protein n=1 Tax=Globodera pallida TaxID=36090 RepID=A0A183C6T7_GLOPA